VSSVARVTRQDRPPTPSAIHTVKFEQRPRLAPRPELAAPCGSVPRVVRLLALAHRIDGTIRSGELRDWADAARLIGITRARMTQIANLLLLAPKIQEGILVLPSLIEGQNPVSEHDLRPLLATVVWAEQRPGWTELRDRGLPD
jgi:hypothetical protein